MGNEDFGVLGVMRRCFFGCTLLCSVMYHSCVQCCTVLREEDYMNGW